MADEIASMLVSGHEDLIWFDANVSRLKSKYNNKFIAFQDKQILDSDSNLDNLLKKLKGTDSSRVIVKFVSNVKAIL